MEAKKRVELERLQTLKELDMAQARFHAITAIEREGSLDAEAEDPLPRDGMGDYVEEYLNNHAIPETATTSVSSTAQIAVSGLTYSGITGQTTTSSSNALNPCVETFVPRCTISAPGHTTNTVVTH